MNTVVELRALAKSKGLKGYSRLRKADLISLLEQSSSQPVAPPRREGKRRPVTHVKIIPHPQDMDIFEKQEMEKSRPVVKSKLHEWYDWLVHYVPKTVQSKVSDAFKTFKNKIEGLWRKVAGKEDIQRHCGRRSWERTSRRSWGTSRRIQEGDIDLTPQEHEHALNRAYRSFRSPGLPKVDVDTYIDKITPYMRLLIEQQIKEMGLAKVQLCMWVKWKKTKEMVLQLDAEELNKQRISLEKFIKS